jgi:large subunit ribosomal protein L33
MRAPVRALSRTTHSAETTTVSTQTRTEQKAEENRTARSDLFGRDLARSIRKVRCLMARTELRPVVTLRSTAGTGHTYVTRKSRRNDPDRLVLRKYDPVVGRHVLFREER